MIEDKQPLGILVDVDTIMDTRLPLVFMMSPDIGRTILKDGSYVNRKKNNFKTISSDVFNTLYRNRKKELLTFATPTHILSLIKSQYGDFKNNELYIDSDIKPTIYLNTYPYTFNSVEAQNFEFMIQKYIPDANVKTINLSNIELTPEWLHNNIKIVFKYDILDWIEYHTAKGNLVNRPLLDVCVIGPALITGVISSRTITKDTFNSLISAVSTVIDLSIIDVSYFSAVVDLKK